MGKSKENKSALNIRKGVVQPPSVNPDALIRRGHNRKKKYSVEEFVEGIISGNRTILSQAITLIESSNSRHADTAQRIIEKCLPFSAGSIRIGITGVPGAGKSTFIETFLGDKTRMGQLSIDPNAFIRPSPASGTLGGVARKTRETIILCEAAGFNTIIVETVGVGQSETAVSSMVDFFLLLMLAGAGDELQGIKRGIMEMADTIAITKADGNNRMIAEGAKVEFQTALHLFPPTSSGWVPNVFTCSSVENRGIEEIWQTISEYVRITKESGYFEERRKQQNVMRMHDTIVENLKSSFYNSGEIKKMSAEIENQLHEGTITSYKAAWNMLNKYFKK
jgi:LAO/AO transport system kinase